MVVLQLPFADFCFSSDVIVGGDCGGVDDGEDETEDDEEDEDGTNDGWVELVDFIVDIAPVILCRFLCS